MLRAGGPRGSICPAAATPSREQAAPQDRSTPFLSRTSPGPGSQLAEEDLVRYCGFSKADAAAFVQQMKEDNYGTRLLLRRGLTDTAAQWIASHIRRQLFSIRIVEDCGESEDTLRTKASAMELPASPPKSGIGFWGVVGAVIVALLILSLF